MKTWLISWNPERFEIENLNKIVKETQAGKQVVEKWNCANHNVKVGDRIFLIKLGKEPRGIFAAGYAASEGYEAPHYIKEKAKKGEVLNFINVTFDYVLDPKNQKLLQLSTLNEKFSEQTWTSMVSGIRIKDDIVLELEKEWALTIGIKNDLMNLLKVMPEIIPDKHDGSYELVKETIKAYSKMKNLSKVNLEDILLIYWMSTTQDNKEKVAKQIKKSSLPENLKTELNNTFSNVWKKALNHEYENNSKERKGKVSIGFFNTGFNSFNRYSPDELLSQKIIEALVKIYLTKDKKEIFDYLKNNLNSPIKGIGVPSFSMIAHCLRPELFPIMNGNQGYPDIFKLLNIKLNSNKTIADYAENCENIIDFRNKNFRFKNFRVMDIVSRMMVNINYIGIMEYIENNRNIKYQNPEKPGLSRQRVEELNKIKRNGEKAIKILKKMVEVCTEKYGLVCNGNLQWLDGSNVKTRDYLWAQLKYKEFKDDAESISIFIEMADDKKARLNVSLEVKDDMVKKHPEFLDRHHKFLELPIDKDSDLIYLSGSNPLKNVKVLEANREKLLQKLKNGELKKTKIKISKVIIHEKGVTNEQCHEALLQGVEALIPYYEYVLGIGNRKSIETVNLQEKNPNSSVKLLDSKNIKLLENKNVKLLNKRNAEYDLNMILYGPPGTGKTYNTKIYAVAICDNEPLSDVEARDYSDVAARYEELVKEERIVFTTFHQSYGYEDFIEGIKPLVDKQKNIYYDVVPGVFKDFCDKTKSKKERCVFIIDEINRGNISKIFGELITLIEPNKRIGADEETIIKLPYSPKLFGVPENLYILGTMNTADRSIALIDTALRRRFKFKEMLPESKVLKRIGANKVSHNGKTVDIVKMLDIINKRIEVLYDREHTIGHAFFTSLRNDSSFRNLQSIFEKSIIPLLQEYFYEDYKKIQLVLGDNSKKESKYKFILEEKNNEKEIFKSEIEDNIIPEYRYKIQKEAFTHIESYIEIYED